MPWSQHQLGNQEETPSPPRTRPRRPKTGTTDPWITPATKIFFFFFFLALKPKDYNLGSSSEHVRILDGQAGSVCCPDYLKNKFFLAETVLCSEDLKSGLFEGWISNGLVFKWSGFQMVGLWLWL